jgi:hypothetical protein
MVVFAVVPTVAVVVVIYFIISVPSERLVFSVFMRQEEIGVLKNVEPWSKSG